MEQFLIVVQLITGLLSLAVPFLLYYIKTQNEELKTVKEKVSEKKYEAYTSVFDVFFDTFKKSLNPKGGDRKLVNQLMDTQKELLIYGNDEVLQKYIEWKKSTGLNSIGHMVPLLEIFPLIRKDMGHKNTDLSPKDILSILMLNSEDIDGFYARMISEYNNRNNSGLEI